VLLYFSQYLFYSYSSVSVVWNIKCQEQRFVELSPSDTWGGAGLLGVTIRLDNYGGADERLIRVLDAQDNSPASIAGLVPLKDYLLGTTVTAFGSTPDLALVLQSHVDQVVEIYVYNSDSDVVRVVALMPTYSWGGKGLLGAEVGTGYLHRLPNSSRSTLGQSVERKVRWMGNHAAAPLDKDKDADGNDDDDSSTDESQPLEVEPHLEMEVDQERRRPEEASKQPHELGKEDSTTKKQHGYTSPTKKNERRPDPTGTKQNERVVPHPEQPSNPTIATKLETQPTSDSPKELQAGDSTKESSSSATTTTTTTPTSMKTPTPGNTSAPQPSAELSSPPPPPFSPSPKAPTHSNLLSPTHPNLLSPLTMVKSVSLDEVEALFSGPPPLYGVNNSFMPPPPKMHL
jgi:hypothetical protein